MEYLELIIFLTFIYFVAMFIEWVVLQELEEKDMLLRLWLTMIDPFWKP